MWRCSFSFTGEYLESFDKKVKFYFHILVQRLPVEINTTQKSTLKINTTQKSTLKINTMNVKVTWHKVVRCKMQTNYSKEICPSKNRRLKKKTPCFLCKTISPRRVKRQPLPRQII